MIHLKIQSYSLISSSSLNPKLRQSVMVQEKKKKKQKEVEEEEEVYYMCYIILLYIYM
jgi:hypothetical protein